MGDCCSKYINKDAIETKEDSFNKDNKVNI